MGPDAGDDELQGLSIADFMTDNMASLLKRWVLFLVRFGVVVYSSGFHDELRRIGPNFLLIVVGRVLRSNPLYCQK